MLDRIVLTGAAGALGSRLREPLSGMARSLVSTDRVGAPETLPNETWVQADLSDLAAVERLMEGATMVVHFGAIADEAPWDDILASNILGAYTVWEAAHRTGARRVIYASSIHAVGMHAKTDRIGVDAPHRPDTFYGLSKCFAEDLGRLYWEKRGLESVHLRILSCTEPVANARALGSWLSYADLVRLVTRSIDTPVVGWTVAYGVSANDRAPVSNDGAGHLGYAPRDNAEAFAEAVLAGSEPPDPRDPAHACQGGPFAVVPLGESGVAMIEGMAAKG
jgi:uronate dehydrogenase